MLKLCVARPEEKDKLDKFAKAWGYESMELDWKKAIARPDIDLIDVCVPNFMHHDLVIAAAEAGKIVVCEKPMAMNVAEAQEMVAAVEKAGVANMVSFNYRRVPAIALAKQLIEEGRIGRPFHYWGTYNQDYTISADVPQGGMALWRLDAKVAGSGVTGDLLAHSIDSAEWLNGPIARVTAHAETFVKERKHAETGKMEPVSIDDACLFIAIFQNGSIGTFVSTRYAPRTEELPDARNQRRNGGDPFQPGESASFGVLPLCRPGNGPQDRGSPDRLADDQRDELRTSLHEELVGAGLHDRLRTHVHQPVRRFPGKPGRRPEIPTGHAWGHADPTGLRRGARKRQEAPVGRHPLLK